MKPKVSIGIPFYGFVEGVWWTQLVEHIATAAVHHIDFQGLLTCGAMTADHSRNIIAQDFLKSDSEWLFWIDSDTIVPIGALPRMLSIGKTLVSGLYYGKNPPHPPIAYYLYNGAFTPLDKETKWEKGEILPVDAAGFGCMLTHRSVFEDIQKNFVPLQRVGGGVTLFHKNDLIGDPEEKHEHDGKVYRGQFRERLRQPTLENLRYPFFAIEHMRTEDMYFFDNARRVGHKCWLDTSIECGHLRPVAFQGSDYRELNGH